MEATELLATRRSFGKLGEPAPQGEALEQILAAALRAPDHGALRPWFVLLVRGEGRARLGAIFAESLRRRRPDAGPEELERERKKPERAPLLAVVVATVRPGPIPEVEQLLSAGCVAHGIVLGAQAHGFGALWRTGEQAYDPWVAEQLGLGAADRIVGFVYVGSVRERPPEAPRPAVSAVVRSWPA